VVLGVEGAVGAYVVGGDMSSGKARDAHGVVEDVVRAAVPPGDVAAALMAVRNKVLTLHLSRTEKSARQVKEMKKAKLEAERLALRLPRKKRKMLWRESLARLRHEDLEVVRKAWERRHRAKLEKIQEVDRESLSSIAGQRQKLVSFVNKKDQRGAVIQVHVTAGTKLQEARQGTLVQVTTNALILLTFGNKVLTVPKKGSKFSFKCAPELKFWGDMMYFPARPTASK